MANKHGLHVYCTDVKDEIDTFENWWMSKHQAEPDKFPLELTGAEWEEMFQLWQSCGSEGVEEMKRVA